ncbi:MAG: cytochrome c3 family protein [Armatimonadota bacterium]
MTSGAVLVKFLIMLVITTALFAAAILNVQAGEYHIGEQNVCSDCHVSHASKDGAPVSVSENLLRSSTGEIGLCMSCHDGSNAMAPDIVSNGTATSPSDVVATRYASKYGSSAGFFQGDYLQSDSPYGHSLLPQAAATAPLSTSYSKLGGLVCSDCHDSHGNGNYRNLLTDPNPASPGSFPILIGTHVSETVPVNAQNPNPAVAYDTGNVGLYTANNLAGWCTDCHDQLAANGTGTPPAHYLGHPSDVEIGGAGAHTDSSNWINPVLTDRSGFGTDIGDLTAGIPRVRYGSPTGSNQTAGMNDTVTCLSCHKAHGSKYQHGLLWPHTEGGADMYSGCQQCHFK